MNLSVIIAHYSSRPNLYLRRLLFQLQDQHCEIVVVENTDFVKCSTELSHGEKIKYFKRPNFGMNIGAWEFGAHFANKDNFLFLQDECSIKFKDSLEIVLENIVKLGRNAVLGESINRRWDQPWDFLTNSGQLSEAQKNKACFYKEQIKAWGIDPGIGGRHLRTIVLAMTRENKELIGAFPQGHNKAQCIAAEIAISKRAESLGLALKTFTAEEFGLFSHPEWEPNRQNKVRYNSLDFRP